MSYSSYRNTLLQLARDSIHYGLEHGEPLPVDTASFDEQLQRNGAAFVTLQINHQLRGCIGSLEAFQPLVEDIAHNAFAAAFRDPRFPMVSADEIDQLDIHISILTPAQEMTFHSEQDLLDQLRPGIDGLILEYGSHRGTFLPSVWESLPERRDFFDHLKMKAGLTADFWSDDVRVSRYETESIK
jgi:AmmeMemoRadiSam system protein A